MIIQTNKQQQHLESLACPVCKRTSADLATAAQDRDAPPLPENNNGDAANNTADHALHARCEGILPGIQTKR